jgi:3-oxoacyl-[acyl-carrier-protein] synthase-3
MADRALGARILSLGAYRPANVVSNEDIGALIGVSDEWIRRRAGVVSRHIAAPEETVADMAVAAGGKALAGSGLSPRDVDLVIVATCTQEAQIPQASAIVAHRLGMNYPGSYDINVACAGFCYALACAGDAVRAGSASNVLVIGAEKLSAWVNWNDRETCVLFGDGAGAAVVAAADTGFHGIGPVVWGSVGEDADKIAIRDRNSFISQEGQSVYRWAVTRLAPVALAACEKAGVPPQSLAAFVPHQGNLRIVQGIARRIGAPQAIVADDIIRVGNTSAASIPLALSRLLEGGNLLSGAPVLLLGYGAGLSYAAQVISVP